MKLTAIVNGKRVEVEVKELSVTFPKGHPKLTADTPVEIESPNEKQSHLNSRWIVDKDLGEGTYTLKFNSKMK